MTVRFESNLYLGSVNIFLSFDIGLRYVTSVDHQQKWRWAIYSWDNGVITDVHILTFLSQGGTLFFLSPRKYKLITITDKNVDSVIIIMFRQ